MKLAAAFAILGMGAVLTLGLARCDKDRDEMRPDMDKTMSGAHGLQAHDLHQMTDQMAPDLLQIPEITNNPTKITVVVKGIENKTETEPGKNFDIYVARLAGLLNSSQARNHIQFIEERRLTGRMQNEELGNPDTFGDAGRGNGPADPTMHPQFFLYGTFYSMNNGRATYYLCEFKLTDSATGRIVWGPKQYETQTLNVR